MTEIEARGYIKGKLDCMNKCDTFDCLNSDDCDECYYCYAQGTFGEQKEAFEIAIQALKKQEKIKSIITDKKKQYRQGLEEIEQIVKGGMKK